MPKLAITLAKDAPSDTVVTRDGTEVGAVSLHTALPIDLGHHVVVARGGGFERQFDVTLAEGETKNLEVTPHGGKAVPKPPVAAADKPSPTSNGAAKNEAPRTSAFKIEGPASDRVESGSSVQRTLGFITLGAGLIGVGAGGYFGARVLMKKSDASTMCTPGDPCVAGSDEVRTYEDTKRDARNARTNAYIGLGVGGAVAVTGVILLLTAPKSTTTGWRFAPTVGQSAVGAVIDGTW
jgi:hypothetical protein